MRQEEAKRLTPGARSFVDEVLQGTLDSSVKCLHCGRVSRRDEFFLDLSLPFPQRFLPPEAVVKAPKFARRGLGPRAVDRRGGEEKRAGEEGLDKGGGEGGGDGVANGEVGGGANRVGGAGAKGEGGGAEEKGEEKLSKHKQKKLEKVHFWPPLPIFWRV
jgi:hypothetical protein